LNIIPKDTILTPHPKEFERLVGSWTNGYEKLEKQMELSSILQSVVVLKGAYTSIAYNGKVYFNSSGNPGLATAGSGDVLTGIITGLLAQGYSSLQAAIVGVYLHGRTADLGIESNESIESFTAMDCMIFLGKAFKEFK
jgi:NAD(P)H-hydrate epimerase